MIAGVTIFLFLRLGDSSTRSQTFNFTLGFVVFLEAAVFASLAHIGARVGGAAGGTPLSMARTVVVGIYCGAAAVTVVLFEWVLPPRAAGPKLYYTIAVGETGLGLASLVLLQLVGISRSSDRPAEAARERVLALIARCGRLRTLAQLQGWDVSSQLSELTERIRLSESLRRDEELFQDISAHLDRLEALAKAGGNETAGSTAQDLVRVALALASQS